MRNELAAFFVREKASRRLKPAAEEAALADSAKVRQRPKRLAVHRRRRGRPIRRRWGGRDTDTHPIYEGLPRVTADAVLAGAETVRGGDILFQEPGYGGFGTSPAWASNRVLYVSSENQRAAAVRVVKSTDGGVTWSAADHGLPRLPVNRIIVDPRTPNGDIVYAANWIGVYRTTDGGATWSRFGAGLPNVYVSDLYIAPDASFLRVSTYGRGVWEIKP